MTGRSPSGRATHERSHSTVGVPNARARYEFLTPHFRGFDLVWDFLCQQPGAAFTDGTLTIKGSYGYERARDLRLFADGQQIGHGAELWDRFAALEPVFQRFWSAFERAAEAWRREKIASDARDAAERKRQDEALCAKVLAAASAIEARQGQDAKHESAVPERQTPKGDSDA